MDWPFFIRTQRNGEERIAGKRSEGQRNGDEWRTAKWSVRDWIGCLSGVHSGEEGFAVGLDEIGRNGSEKVCLATRTQWRGEQANERART